MTRRPIFIGFAAILALALTAGLAYGAGRLVGTRPSSHPVREQRIGTTSVAPGSFSNHRGQALQGSGYGSAFRSQMRGWMQDWMRNHSGNRQSWAGAGYGRQAAGQGSGTTSGGYSRGARNGYWDDHHTSSGHWGGSGSGGYGYGGYRYGDDRHDGCW